jgi:hypothetical protein
MINTLFYLNVKYYLTLRGDQLESENKLRKHKKCESEILTEDKKQSRYTP